MKLIKKMALASYKNGTLDKSLVDKVTKNMKRKELKGYLKELKSLENKKTVIITVADINIQNELLKKIKSIFKDKTIKVVEDKSLLGGFRINDFDTVYEFDLKSKLENLSNFIGS